MPNLHLKVKAIRLLRHISQESTAHQAHFHIKTYQRKEAGNSLITNQDLVQLSVPFQCSVDDISNFDLGNNTFSQIEKEHAHALEVENNHLKSEVSYLRQLLDKLVATFSSASKSGGRENEL